MKKVIIILVVLLGVYSIFQIGKDFISDIPVTNKNIDSVDN